jgi:protein-serine/threonine kinase
MSGPSSPVLEDVHRFPAESLHSFSFAKQSEDYLHSRQAILQKSVDFMRDRSAWASNPALAEAQARVSGNAEIQGMIDLLKKANVLPVDTKESKLAGLGLGPMTGPPDVDGRNVFDKSFSEGMESVEEAIISPLPTPAVPDRRDSEQTATSPMLELPPTSSAERGGAGKRLGLKRTYTDLTSLTLQQKLIEALAQPYSSDDHLFAATKAAHPVVPNSAARPPAVGATSVHAHSSKWSPAAQAVFRTDADAPWTILAANDLACLIFGVTRAEVRSLSILGIIQEERRQWLEEKLGKPVAAADESAAQASERAMAHGAKSLLGSKAGITARLLSKTPSRVSKPSQRAQTDDGSGGYYRNTPKNHPPTKSRGVLLCGDIVPIQKRNGTIGSASFWVMEKRGGLIWVIEEINEDIAILIVDEKQNVTQASGSVQTIWGQNPPCGTSIKAILPRIPTELSFFDRRTPSGQPAAGHFTARTASGLNVPTTVSKVLGRNELRVSSLPHIAGMMVLSPDDLTITSSNSVFSAALFGYEQPGGMSICTLIPSFEDILTILTDEDDVQLTDGLVVPEHSFRRARALLALREGSDNAASIFLRPSGLPATHRDGSEIMVDVQMRVVRSETVFPVVDDSIEEKDETRAETNFAVAELVYAVWITYSRQLHAAGQGFTEPEPTQVPRPFTPPTQPEPPAQLPSPPPAASDDSGKSNDSSQLSLLSPQVSATSFDEPLEHPPPHTPFVPHDKKTINDFIILEEMGSGAYGQVKLGRYKKSKSRKMVLKYVTKKRILVDTWTRDRRLGTVPLEIHVMDYLRRDGLRHPNIVEMVDFFEDDTNYYIEMLPHGIPGMDLFDYIELRANMEEAECKNIFRQVVDAIHHLHVVAKVVHRDVKDENVVLDGEGRIKLIDFGSATYIKNGPFDVFVGTIGKKQLETFQGNTADAPCRLCSSGGAPRQSIWRQGARHLGNGDSSLHDCVQGESFLQHW